MNTASATPSVRRNPDDLGGSAAFADVNALGFEAAFAALEAAVQQLENGELPLEGAVAAYEQGLVLAKRCAELLEQVELKIRQVDGVGEDAGALVL